MEQKIIKIDKDGLDKEIKKQALFLWSLKEKKEKGFYVFATFERDENAKNYRRVKELEKEYNNIKTPSLTPIFIFIALTIIFFTLFVIFAFVFKDPQGSSTLLLTWILSFVLPGTLSLLTVFILYFLRMKKTLNYLDVLSKKQGAILLELTKMQNEE